MAQSIRAEAADEYYVSPDGKDEWSGTLPAPNEEGTDGPFGSISHARKVIRRVRETGRLPDKITVYLREGRYRLERPLRFRAADSTPVVYTSYPGEEAVIDGGRTIDGWSVTEVNGTQAWMAELPEVAEGEWFFRQLFVNGERRPRASFPKDGLYRVAEVPGMPESNRWGGGSYSEFRLEEGQMQEWKNLTDVEIVLFHFWIDERFPVADFDAETEMITSSRASQAPLSEGHGEKLAPCAIEHVFEALTEPGEWYLDREEGKLYYIPKQGETPENTEVVAPRLLQLIRAEGQPRDNQYVEHIRFRDLRFEHTRCDQPGPAVEDRLAPALRDEDRPHRRWYRGEKASAPQGAADVPGVLYFQGARNCAVEDCRVAHVGWYGIELADGCRGNRIEGNEIADGGAGGVKMNGASYDEPPCLRTGNNRITDNRIHRMGRVHHSGIGVLSMHSYGNVIAHNHIHDLYYSGISCGWVWGYSPSISRDNIIEDNHIHDIGQGMLSDMGGIYTLGVQPGTVLRRNLIHDVEKLNYGAWCIYPDEGSSHILIENNICYRTNGEIFHQHYGRENQVRNNIFAFGGDSITAHGRTDLQHKAFTLERNVMITDGQPIYSGGYGAKLKEENHRSDLNLLWDVGEKQLTFKDREETVEMDGWRELGHDRHSLVADPQCQDPRNDDFTLAPDSPAITELGFQPIDLSDVGPRDKENRG